MPRTSTLVRLIDGLLEMAWLFIIVGVPVFFNVRDYRVFEPDKIVLLRNMVLVMVALFLIKAIYVAPYYLAQWTGNVEGQASRSFSADLKTGLRRRPIIIAALVFAVVYVIASLQSILPTISFWGSYDRLEGAYTYLTYIALFLLVLSHIRTWQQIERLVTAVIFASVPVAAYSWLQHFNSDPLIWASNGVTAQRTPSTLGNPIFLAAYLCMTVPFTLHRLSLKIVQLLKTSAETTSNTEQLWTALATAGYAAALGLQLGGVSFSGSRGPALGLLAAIIVFGLAVAVRRRITWLLRLTTALAVLLVLVFGATNTVFRGSDKPGAGFSRFLHLLPSESGSSEVRSLLWTSSLSLVKEHPVLGCGPEVLIFCWYPHYPTELRKVELANAAPDRSHDEEIDVLLTSGIIGELAYLAFLGITTTVLIHLVRRSTNLRSLTFAAALLAAFLGHIVEGLTGIAFSATLSTLWLIAAVATALYAGDPAGAAGSYAGAVVTDSGKESLPTDEGRVAADRTGKQSVATRGGQAKHQRELGPRARAAMQNQRRALDRAGQYAASAVLGRLKGGAMAILGLSAIVALAAIIFAGALFVSNLQIIQADASYRLAQNYEVAAGQVVNKSGQYQEALATYQAAISSYQDALNSVPTWIDLPPQDAYYLFLGKTLLEYADALRLNKNGTSTPQQVDGVLQQALNIFLQAQKANPLNPDHPRNIGKLYNYWATTVYKTPDVPKLVLGDTYFAKASSLAPHNSDILDEWGVLDMTIGNLDATQAHARYAQALDHLMKARNLYPESGAVYRDLGTAYAKYSQFATDQHQSAESLKYARLQEQAWLTALKYNAPQHEMLYPRLAELYRATFHDTCSAGQYAFFGLQNIRSGALADPDGSLAAALQNMLTAATTHGCHLVTQ